MLADIWKRIWTQLYPKYRVSGYRLNRAHYQVDQVVGKQNPESAEIMTRKQAAGIAAVVYCCPPNLLICLRLALKFLDARDELLLALVTGEACIDRIQAELGDFFTTHRMRRSQSEKIIVHVAAEIGRVVRVQRDAKAMSQ